MMIMEINIVVGMPMPKRMTRRIKVAMMIIMAELEIIKRTQFAVLLEIMTTTLIKLVVMTVTIVKNYGYAPRHEDNDDVDNGYVEYGDGDAKHDQVDACYTYDGDDAIL